MKRALLLALAAACPTAVLAEDSIPAHLTGVWATADSLSAGTTAQAELYLQPDGFGLIIGSSAPSVHTSGPDKGKPGLRMAMGFPLRARVEGETLTVLPFNPGNPNDKGPSMNCRYQASDTTLHCAAPDRSTLLMKRRSASLDARTMQMIDDMRIAVRAYAGKASALRPAASILP